MKNKLDTDIKVNEIELEAYRQCFSSKHHYDVLSWTIGGFVCLLQVAIISGMFKIDPCKGAEFLILKIFLGILGLSTIVIWFLVYERNRFWGEVANETARDIERRVHISGPALEFMKSTLDNEVTLKNRDEHNKPYKNNEEKKETPLPKIIMRLGIRFSMHMGIRIIMIMLFILNIYLLFCRVKI